MYHNRYALNLVQINILRPSNVLWNHKPCTQNPVHIILGLASLHLFQNGGIRGKSIFWEFKNTFLGETSFDGELLM
jgi:hypothetical protein